MSSRFSDIKFRFPIPLPNHIIGNRIHRNKQA